MLLEVLIVNKAIARTKIPQIISDVSHHAYVTRGAKRFFTRWVETMLG
jgi:hypothetical protein